jgi:hypothetical protein
MSNESNNGVHQHHYVFQGEPLPPGSVDVFALLESRRLEAQRQNEVLHARITELRDDLNEKLDQSHREIMHEIRLMREEQHAHAKEMSERVSKLERWKWSIIGGAAVIGFIVAGGLENITHILK